MFAAMWAIFSEKKELDMPHLIADVMFTLKLYQTYITEFKIPIEHQY